VLGQAKLLLGLDEAERGPGGTGVRAVRIAVRRLGAYPGDMTLTVHLDGGLAAALEAEAARRGQSPDEVATDLLAGSLPAAPASDPVEAFIGAADSGDTAWAGRDTHHLRTEAAVRRAGQPG
jgi:hypothetical protein